MGYKTSHHSTKTQFLEMEDEIQKLLIIGESDTSVVFSKNLIQLANFTRIIHVIKAEDAISLILQEEFPLIVIDNDAPDVDCTPFTNILRKNIPLSRIVVIGSTYTVDIIKKLINEGSVDAFIPIPIDDFTAHSIIIEQQAKHKINSILNKMVTEDPPRFSPQYYLIEDPSLSRPDPRNSDFMGLVITHSSVTKYSKFYSDFFNLDEYLLTGYISAISVLGKQLFNKETYFEEINLAGTSIVLYIENEIQYLFFFKQLSKSSYRILEKSIKDMIEDISNKLGKELKRDYLSEEDHNYISKKLDKLKKKQLRYDDFQRKQDVVLYGNQLPKLNSILYKKQDKYNITRIMDQKRLTNYLINNEPNLLVINQVLQEDNWNFTLASQAKDILPELQIIALLKNLNQPNLVKILNNDYLDYVLSYKDSEEQIEKYFDAALKQAVKIKQTTIDQYPHNLQYSLHQATIARSKLRTEQDSFQQSKIPELYGLFISNGDVPFYTHFWENGKERINIDQQLFAGFLTSMEMFTDELFDTKEEFSGLKFGDIHIITKKIFDFTFAFFVGDLNHTNFIAVDHQLKKTSKVMYEIIVNSDVLIADIEADPRNIETQIDQTLYELNLKFTALNLV